jgi:hypothetical protein
MSDTPANELSLESLGTGIPTLTPEKASMLRQACQWCFRKCDHSTGVLLQSIIWEKTGCYKVTWNEEGLDIDRILSAYNCDDAVESAAEAIALLLAREETPFTAIRRAVKTTGIDYWLGSLLSKIGFGKK